MKIKLPDKLTKFWEEIDEKNFYRIFWGALVLIFILDYVLFMRLQLNALWKINPQIKELSENYKQAKVDIERQPEYEKQVEQLKQVMVDVQVKIKSREDVPLILERISRLAQENGIKIDQITPFSGQSTVLLEKSGRKYYSVPISVEAQSGYHDFGRFLNRLENDKVFLKTDSFTFLGKGSGSSHSIKLILQAIVYEEGGAT